MKTTDEMILDLVAAGFVLPEGTEPLGGYLAIKGDSFTEVDTRQKFAAILLLRQLAYDLIAPSLARQWSERHGLSSERPPMHASLGYGDTEAAIKALWEGVFDEG